MIRNCHPIREEKLQKIAVNVILQPNLFLTNAENFSQIAQTAPSLVTIVVKNAGSSLRTRPRGLLFATPLTSAAQIEHRIFFAHVFSDDVTYHFSINVQLFFQQANHRPTIVLQSSVHSCDVFVCLAGAGMPRPFVVVYVFTTVSKVAKPQERVACDTHSSPYPFRSNSYISVPVLPAFQQNFISLRCSIFVSTTIVVNTPRANCYNFTVTAPILLGFFSSCVRHPTTFFQWQTSGRATRFATQKSVLKLSCHTVYITWLNSSCVLMVISEAFKKVLSTSVYFH